MTHAIAARAALTPAPSPTLRRLAAVLFAAAALGFAGSAAAQDSLPEEVRETRDRDAELRIEMDNSPELDPANRPEDPHVGVANDIHAESG